MNQVATVNPSVGLLDLQSFENTQRIANMLSQSTLVPEQYRAVIAVKTGKKDAYGNQPVEHRPNPNGLANCIIALNMANRMGADPLMVMQNLYLIEGRPAWSSQFILASLNSCGRFSALRFDMEDLGEIEVEYTEYEWANGSRKAVNKKTTVRNLTCVAWAIEGETGERIESSKISVEMAVKEGWYQKNGSKWKTMPEQMLRYRSASFFGRIYAPEILMGLRSDDEEREVIDITPTVQTDNSVKVSVSNLKQRILSAQQSQDLDTLEQEIKQLHHQELMSDKDYDVLSDLIHAKSSKLAPIEVVETKPEIDLRKYYSDIAYAQNLEQLERVAEEIKTLDLGEPAKTDLRNAYKQRKEQLLEPSIDDVTLSELLDELENATSLEQLNQILAEKFEPFTSRMYEHQIEQVTNVYERKVAELTD